MHLERNEEEYQTDEEPEHKSTCLYTCLKWKGTVTYTRFATLTLAYKSLQILNHIGQAFIVIHLGKKKKGELAN